MSSTRSIVIGLFVMTGESALTASQLIALGQQAGVTATNLKSHLTRMVADGSLIRTGTARCYAYAPSRSRRHVIDTIHGRFAPRRERWDGRWVVLALELPAERAARERLRKSLGFHGFRALHRMTWVRPAWPRAEAVEQAERLAGRARGTWFLGEPGVTGEVARLLRLFRLDQLERRAAQLLARMQSALQAAAPERAFAARLAIGEAIARLLSDVPDLPDECWGARRSVARVVDLYRTLEPALARRSDRLVRAALGNPAGSTVARERQRGRSA